MILFYFIRENRFGKLDPLQCFIVLFPFVELVSIFNAKFSLLTLQVFILHLCFVLTFIVSSGFAEEKRNKLLIGMATAGFLTSIYGILQAAGLDFLNWVTGYGGRIHSTLGNPNFYAGWLVVFLPVSLWQSCRTKKFYWILLSVLLTVNLFLTKTYGAWIGFVCSIIYLLLESKASKLQGKIWAAAVIFLLFFVIVFFGGRILPREQSVRERIFKWKTALEMVREHPVIGVGAGNLKVNFALYQAKVKREAGERPGGTSESNVHNEYFQLWAESGTLGLGMFFAVFIFYFFWLKKSTPENIGFTAAVIGFLIFSLTNFPLRIVPTALYLFIFMGLSFPPPDGGKIVSPGKKTSFPVKFIAGVIYLVVCYKFAIIPFAADVYRSRGDASSILGKYSDALKYYEKSIKIDYIHSERTAYDLGEIYRTKLSDVENALRSYKISVDIRNYGEVYNNIANCYWIKKDIEGALLNWETARSLGLPGEEDQKTVEKNIEYSRKIQARVR